MKTLNNIASRVGGHHKLKKMKQKKKKEEKKKMPKKEIKTQTNNMRLCHKENYCCKRC